jgi:hypothetical protein
MKAKEAPSFQHFLDVFHGCMEASNEEFCAFLIALYTTQAPANCDIYMSIHPGFTVNNNHLIFSQSSTKDNCKEYVLGIKKNMYGLKQAGNNWFDALHISLLARGFSQSSNDPCLFIRSDCISLVYIDNCRLFTKSNDILDSILASLEKDFFITSQGSVGACLGIDI